MTICWDHCLFYFHSCWGMLELLATYQVDIFYLVGYIHVICSHFHSDVIVGCQGMGVAFRNTFVGQFTEYHDMKVGARGRTVILLFSRSVAQLCPTLCNPVDWSMPGFLVLHHLAEPAQTHVHWVGDAIQPSHLLPSPSPPIFSLSQHQGLFQCCYVWSKYPLLCNMFHDALHIQWPQYLSFSISPSNEYSGLISFRIDWYDHLAVQRTLKSLLQHHSLKASILSLFYCPSSHIHTWLLEKPQLWLHRLCRQSNVSAFQYAV